MPRSGSTQWKKAFSTEAAQNRLKTRITVPAVHYADSSTLLTGLTADGAPLWTANVNVPSAYDPVADGLGGVLVNKMSDWPENYAFIAVDGQTGKQVWRYDSPTDQSLQGPPAIGPDGAIYVVDRIRVPEPPAAWIAAMRLVALDGETGLPRLAYTFPFGTEVRSSGTRRLTPWIAPPVIGPDGTVFASPRVYKVNLRVFELDGTNTIPMQTIIKSAQDLWRRQSDGTISLVLKSQQTGVDPCVDDPGCPVASAAARSASWKTSRKAWAGATRASSSARSATSAFAASRSTRPSRPARAAPW